MLTSSRILGFDILCSRSFKYAAIVTAIPLEIHYEISLINSNIKLNIIHK